MRGGAASTREHAAAKRRDAGRETCAQAGGEGRTEGKGGQGGLGRSGGDIDFGEAVSKIVSFSYKPDGFKI